ncbi:MAG: hypothetical protein ACJ8F3_09835 [Xanthobacteraceae bacterium]
MTLPSPAFLGLEDMLDPSRGDGVDMRPTLLRVLTDLYVQRPTHTPDDEQYFTELALRLIEATDVTARAALSARLAAYPAAPVAVVQRLARDVIEVAAPVLNHACLGPAERTAIAQACGEAHARVIASLPSPASALISSPAIQPRPEPPNSRELSELFYAAGPAERRLILLGLDYCLVLPAPVETAPQPGDVWRFESAVLRQNREILLRDLQRGLGIARTQAARIIADDFGEPIVVAAKAMKLPSDVVQRVVLFLNPKIGQSIDRVYELAELYVDISVDAARRMIAIWRDADQPEGGSSTHTSPTWRTAAENARRALSQVSQAADGRRESAAKAANLRVLR